MLALGCALRVQDLQAVAIEHCLFRANDFAEGLRLFIELKERRPDRPVPPQAYEALIRAEVCAERVLEYAQR